jgi:hypothetical protein
MNRGYWKVERKKKKKKIRRGRETREEAEEDTTKRHCGLRRRAQYHDPTETPT